MALKRTEKSTYSLSAKAKHRLRILKANLLLAGVAGASETGILEVLIEDADEKQLAKRLKRR